ncbi:hypothetical protein J8J40_24890, partial [Mycobacterium tuberculosis]|nr:hypothetical protein [Mycobacterium tuberculosis]
MSFLTKTLSASLVATVLVAGTAATAEAKGGHFWGGFAVGAATGIIASNAYGHGYGYGGYYRPAPVYYAPVCHKEWRYDYYGNPY